MTKKSIRPDDVKTKILATKPAVATPLFVFIGISSLAVTLGTSIALFATVFLPPQNVRIAIFETAGTGKAYTQPDIPGKFSNYIKQTTAGNFTLRAYPSVNNAGLHLSSNTALADGKIFTSCFKESAALKWERGHDFPGRMTKTKPSGSSYVYEPLELYITSLFNLAPATTYVACVPVNGGPCNDCDLASNPKVTFTTQPTTNALAGFSPTRTVTVDQTKTTDAARGIFKTITEAINDTRTGPGTRILVKPGVYREALSFPESKSGAFQRWIQILADGPGVILDGSYAEPVGSNGVFSPSTSWKKSTIVGFNDDYIYERPYQNETNGAWKEVDLAAGKLGEYLYRHETFDSFKEAITGRTDGNCDDAVVFGFKDSWYLNTDNNKIYLRLRDQRTPEERGLVFASQPNGIYLDSSSWVWIEGLTIRYFGSAENFSAGVIINNGDFNIIRNNTLVPNRNGVAIQWMQDSPPYTGVDGSSYNRIEGNTISTLISDEDIWYCKTKTGAAYYGLYLAGGIGNIAAGNEIYRIGENSIEIMQRSSMQKITNCDGELPCYDLYPYVQYETEVLNNIIHDNVEGIEPDGGQVVNTRIIGNTLWNIEIYLLSMQGGQYGPVWLVRNLWARSPDSRYGESNLAEVFKFRYGYLQRYLFVYHNNIWANQVPSVGQSLNAYGVKNRYRVFDATFYNNIFYTKGSIVAKFNAIKSDDPEVAWSGKPDFDYNSFSAESDTKVEWEGKSVTSPQALCGTYGIECHGSTGKGFWATGFSNPDRADFSLLAQSKNIDAGVVIPNISTPYYGNAPDIGANELWGFVRGDTNSDGVLNITDPISTLQYLFLGSEATTCPDASDFDDSGSLQLTDAVKTLTYLFSGDKIPPPPPFQSCGYDPTPDDISCTSFPACAAQ